jgi:hypothetical protein
LATFLHKINIILKTVTVFLTALDMGTKESFLKEQKPKAV